MAPSYRVERLAEPRTIRLISTARLRDPVLLPLAPAEHLAALAEIEGATSARLLAQENRVAALPAAQLVHGVPAANIVNAAFAYARPRGLNRFNGPERGAWYAALARETCIAEVAFHMTRELENVGDFNATVDFGELFASFAGEFADLRDLQEQPLCLDPDPARGYGAGNALALEIMANGHNGVIYPSLRHAGGICLAALWPHAVQSVAQGDVIRLRWAGSRQPVVEAIG